MPDPAALWASRYSLRQTYEAIKRLRTTDPTIGGVLERLDQMCVDLTAELEAMEPTLELVHPVLVDFARTDRCP